MLVIVLPQRSRRERSLARNRAITPRPIDVSTTCHDTNMCSVQERFDRAHASFSSARAELLSAIGELLATDAWHGDGAGDPASWIAARCQMSIRTARELVRDAEALAPRPALSGALASGAISIDQCKALVVLGDADSDDAALESLPFWSYGELEREARRQRARALEKKDSGTYLRMEPTHDERFLRGEFQLNPLDGAALIAAIDARIPDGTSLRDLDGASAVALVELAKGAPGAAERPIVLVDGDVAELSSGAIVGPATADLLTCDATIQTQSGTRSAIPAATRRKVEARDGRKCTFPGCEKDVFLDCHHIVHRANGGSNDASNLQLVCWIHHALIHKGGWSLRGAAADAVWVRPDGSPFDPRPPDP